MKKIVKRVSAILLTFALVAAYLPLLGGAAEASTYYSFSKPTAGATYKAGKKVPVKFWAGVERSKTKMDAWGQEKTKTYEDMPVILKVFKGKTEIYSQEYTYQQATHIATTYTPTTTGTLKLCVYGCDLGLYTSPELQDTTTIKVKKAKASTVKNVKPVVTVERTDKTKARISCYTNYGYSVKIYRATKKNGKYKLIKTTKKNTFVDTKLSAKKVYYYKVKVYAKSGKKTYKSKWSKKVECGKYTEDLALSKVSSGVKLKWKPINGDGFYLVRRSTKGVPGEDDVIDCLDGTDTEYIDTTAEKGKTYYYSVIKYDESSEKIAGYSGTKYKIAF